MKTSDRKKHAAARASVSGRRYCLNAWLVIALASGPMVGCLAPTGEELDEAGQSEPLDQTAQPIIGGIDPYWGNGTVEFRNCTGVLLGKSMVLTASRCFKDLGTKTSASVKLKLSVFHGFLGGSSGGWSCLTGDPLYTKCTVDRWVRVRRYASYDAKHDLAAIFPDTRGGEFEYVDNGARGLDIVGLKAGDKYTQYGRGRNSWDWGAEDLYGKMQLHDDTIDWVSSYYFITHADGYTRVCDGDEGGPYFNLGGYVIGIQSSFDKPSRGYCAGWDYKTRATRITRSKLDQITEWRLAEGHSPCAQRNTTQWECD